MAKAMVLTKENVIATMAGRKRMTRRIINPQPKTDKSILCTMIDTTSREDGKYRGWNYWAEYEDICEVKGTRTKYFKPRYQVGDEVYIAEGYQIRHWHSPSMNITGIYTSDNQTFDINLTEREWNLFRNRIFPDSISPGRFMYKSLARTFMTITGVGAERVQDISLKDIIAEGITPKNRTEPTMYIAWYNLWDSIHGEGAAADNKWVFWYKWERSK